MFLIAIFVIFAMLAQCNFENKDGKDLKFFKATLINLSRETEVSIVGKIFEFKGYLLYYIDQKRQIIVFLNLDKTMTIKFGYNSYQVDPNTNASCVPGSLNEYTFVLNQTHILFQCNGLTRAVVRAGNGIDEKYPFPSFTNYSALIYIINNEEFINYNNKIIYPSPDQPNVTLEMFSVNGVPMINSSKIITEQSNLLSLVNSSPFDMNKNKTIKEETDISQTKWCWLVLIVLVAIIGFVAFSIHHRRSVTANRRIDNDLNLSYDIVSEDYPETEYNSRNARVPSDTIIQIQDHCFPNVHLDIHSNRSNNLPSGGEEENLALMVPSEEKYSSQSDDIVLQKYQ